jgi:D-arabinose 1-dehydrogenase-like Zn-dependent alcohol dehydrogenase
MRAIQVKAAGAPFELSEVEVREPQALQVRIKVEACGICHSDAFVKFAGFPGMELPRIPGHEIAGRVDAVGPGVTAFKAGDRVGVGWHGGHCSQCDACRRGLFINCRNAKITGISHDGGYAEYAVVPIESVARIPDGLSATEAGPLLCAGVTTYNSLRNSDARPGDTVAVVGIGGLGHLGIQYAARMGFRTIAVSRGSDKESLARELGAHEYLDTNNTSTADGLQGLGGADLVLVTAPSNEAITSAIGGLKARGTLLLVGAPAEPFAVSAFAMLSGKKIVGWPSGSSIDSEDTMRFSALSKVRPRVEVFPLERAEEAFGTVMSNKVRFRAVLTP